MQDTYKTFSTELEVKEWVEKYYTLEQLSALDVNGNADVSLIAYKGNCAEKMNRTLREKRAKVKFDSGIQKLQELLCKYELPTNIITYRFVSLKEWRALNCGTRFGRVYVHEGFLSTTLLKDQYAMGDKICNRIPILIQVPKGTRGAYLPEVNEGRPEFEILLPYGMKLKKIGFWKYRVVDK